MNAGGPVPAIAPTDAAQRLGRGAAEPGAPGAEATPLLVDVREPNEFATLRIPGAVLLPLGDVASRFDDLPRDRPLILQCASGKRSLAAAEYLRRQGFDDVSNLDGGIIAWRAAGLPVSEGAVLPGEGDLPPR
ncbi:MAG: rhodanese-like domain-containing protein [Chloroflexi bacterium]|nr:rhodanese-like domain-containing protein [Chloroflexota bacterium]